jgi:anti-sigma factor RsiW
MPCEHFEDALTEAAAGAEPQGELRAHLKSCAACQVAFEQERSLFAVIDSGMRVVANAEVPPSFVPRVRAALDEVEAPQRHWMSPVVFVAASVALALAIFLAIQPHHSRPDNQAKQSLQMPVSETSVTIARAENPGPGARIDSSNAKRSQTRGHSTLLRPVASSQPEVLVPPDEREAFTLFVATLHDRSEVALVAPFTEKGSETASLERLRIDQLEVKPLEETEVGASAGTENIR